jgi:hypothetical protein
MQLLQLGSVQQSEQVNFDKMLQHKDLQELRLSHRQTTQSTAPFSNFMARSSVASTVNTVLDEIDPIIHQCRSVHLLAPRLTSTTESTTICKFDPVIFDSANESPPQPRQLNVKFMPPVKRFNKFSIDHTVLEHPL